MNPKLKTQLKMLKPIKMEQVLLQTTRKKMIKRKMKRNRIMLTLEVQEKRKTHMQTMIRVLKSKIIKNISEEPLLLKTKAKRSRLTCLLCMI